MRPSLAERCAPIELLIVDVDGVLTDGGIIYADDGAELKQFHVRDGSGLKIWQFVGKRAALITGRRSKVASQLNTGDSSTTARTLAAQRDRDRNCITIWPPML